MKKQNWEEQMKSSLGNYQQLPSRDLWPEIERKLDKKAEKRPLLIPLWWKAGAIVATAASLALILLLNPSKDLTDNSLVQSDQIIEPNDSQETLTDNNNRVAVNSPVTYNAPDINPLDSPGEDLGETDLQASSELPVKTKITSGTKPVSSANSSNTSIAQNAEFAQNTETPQLIKVNGESENSITNPATIIAQSVIKADDQNTGVIVVALEDKIVQENNADTSDGPSNNSEIVEELQGPVTSLVAEEDFSELILEESKNTDWSIIPVLGPVYYNSLTEGSIFDPSLADNSRQGDITFSYGLRVNLALDKRMILRAGINSVAMGYSTQDIEIATGPAAFGLSSVNYNDNRNIISVFDKGTVPANPDPSNPYSQLNLKSTSGETSIRANLNYLEFPIELSYALIDQQVKLSVISGVSGLLLSNNEVSVNDGQNRYVLGSLNNLNQFSFSTNIGFGLSYKVSQSFNLQLEPTFKYQLGAYNDANVDFTPYQLVLLSGLHFQF